ncbi:MAG: Holliday junction branch migration protein RuvA [Gammaproteobacteria bacterium]
MIGRISGTLLASQPPVLLIDIGGLGYEVEAPMSVFYDLPEIGQTVTLVTHFQVKDDGQTLFGFSNEGQRQLFRNLLKISGIGAKLALTILSGIDIEELTLLVASGDAVALTRLPGIGKKTAERLIVELRDKLDALPVGIGGTSGSSAGAAASAVAEAIQALQSLGYKPRECHRMVHSVASEEMTAEVIIREALKSMVKS